MIKIEKTMCIGGLCEGFIFSDMIKTRILWPVDNWTAKDFKSVIRLFNWELFDDVLNDNITKKEINPWYQSYNDDEYLRTYIDWRTGHTNLEREDRKEEFRKRIQNFQQFNEDIQISKNNNMFYLYTMWEMEEFLTRDDFRYTCKSLPNYVLNNLIFISWVRHKVPEFIINNFRCISYNLDLSMKNRHINKLWDYDDWWYREKIKKFLYKLKI
jgi:hypothetical protein